MSISGFADSALPSQLQAFSELAIFTHNRQQCSPYCHPFTSSLGAGGVSYSVRRPAELRWRTDFGRRAVASHLRAFLKNFSHPQSKAYMLPIHPPTHKPIGAGGD